jgi:hypothetical protein
MFCVIHAFKSSRIITKILWHPALLPSERDRMRDRMPKLYGNSDRKMPCPPAESSLALTDFVNLSPVAEFAPNLPA